MLSRYDRIVSASGCMGEGLMLTIQFSLVTTHHVSPFSSFSPDKGFVKVQL